MKKRARRANPHRPIGRMVGYPKKTTIDATSEYGDELSPDQAKRWANELNEYYGIKAVAIGNEIKVTLLTDVGEKNFKYWESQGTMKWNPSKTLVMTFEAPNDWAFDQLSEWLYLKRQADKCLGEGSQIAFSTYKFSNTIEVHAQPEVVDRVRAKAAELGVIETKSYEGAPSDKELNKKIDVWAKNPTYSYHSRSTTSGGGGIYQDIKALVSFKVNKGASTLIVKKGETFVVERDSADKDNFVYEVHHDKFRIPKSKVRVVSYEPEY